MSKANRKRSIVKAASYRVFATATVFAVALIFTGGWESAAKIGLAAAAAKTMLYYIWERVWNQINWGLQGEVV